MAVTTTRLAEVLNQLAANGVCDSTDVINALTELASLGTGADTTTIEADIATLQGQIWTTATTAQLADATHAINTGANKVAGYQVFNTTTAAPVWAVGNADDDVWNDATGSLAHTPV